ncbi:MAG: hypothetical protein K6T57_12325 [Thermaceae bacterium]|nr:hypothetical protein [Thermaceae bacterium]
MENSPTFWESYRNGVGLALGIATVYLLILALLGWMIGRATTNPDPTPSQGATCSTSWAT